MRRRQHGTSPFCTFNSCEWSDDARDLTLQGLPPYPLATFTHSHPISAPTPSAHPPCPLSSPCARKVFIAARRFKGLTHHAYVFAALLDYHVNKNAEFASKIFFNGLDKYEAIDDYTHAYLSFLHTINDQSNMRVVIERLVKTSEEEGRKRRQREEDDRLKGRPKTGKRRRGGDDTDDLPIHLQPLWTFGCTPSPPPSDDSPPVAGEGGGLGGVWWRYVELERWTATELSTVTKAEDRREVALGLHSPRVAVLIDRWRFMGLFPCTSTMRKVLSLLIRPDLAFGAAGGGGVGVGSGQVVKAYVTPMASGLLPMDPMHPPADVHYVRRRYPGIGEGLLHIVMRVGGGGEGGWVGPLYDVEGVVREIRERVDETKVGEWVERTEVKEGTGGTGGEVQVKMEGGSGEKRKREDGGEGGEREGGVDEGPRPTEPGAVGGDLFRQRRQSKMAKQHS